MNVAHSIHHNVEVYTLSGDLDVYSAPQVKEQLLAGPKTGCAIIDIGQVPFIDSSGLAVLVQAWKAYRSSGGTLCLAGMRPQAESLLHLTQLERLFTLFPDVKTGLKHFKARA
jgi:anti-anti-sigma factor